jgi:hypothetical protein
MNSLQSRALRVYWRDFSRGYRDTYIQRFDESVEIGSGRQGRLAMVAIAGVAGILFR